MAYYPWTISSSVILGKGTATHSFLVMADFPYSLLHKLKATITSDDETQL